MFLCSFAEHNKASAAAHGSASPAFDAAGPLDTHLPLYNSLMLGTTQEPGIGQLSSARTLATEKQQKKQERDIIWTSSSG